MDYDFDWLVEQGVFVFAGVDDDGEDLWSLDMEVAQRVAPEIYWAEKNAIDLAIADAVEEGYLEWDVDATTLEETLTVTDVGAEVVGD